MRIGFFSERYLPQTDGVVYSIESFRRELEALGHEVFIFAPSPNLRYKETNKHIIRFPAIKGLWFEDYMTKFPWTPQAYRRAKKLNLDIVHIHTTAEMGIFGISLALREDIPLVSTYHTDLFEYVKHYPRVLPGGLVLAQMLPLLIGKPELYKSSFTVMRPEKSIDRWNQKIIRKMIPLLNNLCDLVIAPSTKVEAELISWKTTRPIAVLPTGVDKITTNKSEIDSLRQKYRLSPNDKIVSFVGRLAGEKNIELLIRSFTTVARSVPEAKLMLVGDNAYREQLEELTQSLGLQDRVIFTGFITDRVKLGAVYAISRVFAFPSMTDTQGLAINEAACAGVPVVMIDPGIVDVVVDNLSGLYAKNNSADFAEKLILLLTDDKLHARMSKSIAHLSEKFSARKQTIKLDHLYRDVVANHDQAALRETSRNS